jgi:hypothetical protein
LALRRRRLKAQKRWILPPARLATDAILAGQSLRHASENNELMHQDAARAHHRFSYAARVECPSMNSMTRASKELLGDLASFSPKTLRGRYRRDDRPDGPSPKTDMTGLPDHRPA